MSAPLPAYGHHPHLRITLPAPSVAHVELNRPDALNAISEPLWRAIGAAFRQLSLDPDVRAVVLSGAGERAFSAGLDVRAAGPQLAMLSGGGGGGGQDGAPPDVARRARELRTSIGEAQDAVSAIERCEKPVVCVMHGIAFGLAIDLACCADVRLCAADARLAVKEVDVGLAADLGTLARLPKAVGSASWARDVCLTAREFGPGEALAVGFVSRVLDTKADAVRAAVELAATMAEKSPVAVQGTKELLNHGRDHSVAENLRYTAVWNSAMLQSDDFRRALTSSLTRTRPTFEKL